MGILFNIRTLLFLLTGVTFANVGWNLGHFLTYDIGLSNLIPRPEPIFMGFVAFCLAFGFVLTELIVSHPFRSPWQNQNTLWAAISFGIIGGIAVGLIYWAIDSPQFGRALFFSSWQGSTFRWLAWFLVGWATVFAESLAWKTTNIIESSNQKSFWIRLGLTLFFSWLATCIASLLFEGLRGNPAIVASIKKFEAPLGLMILGGCLGMAFAICTAPSYVASLRAGAGFEFREGNPSDNGHLESPLSFVWEDTSEDKYKPGRIEEGKTIILPSMNLVSILSGQWNLLTKGISVGGSSNCDIQLQRVDGVVCKVIPKIDGCELKILNGSKVNISAPPSNSPKPKANRSEKLKHNTIITIYATNQKDFYRFVYYNRFLDPFS